MADMTSIHLDVIAAKAKQLAEDVRAGRLWPGQLSEGLKEIRQQLESIKDPDHA